MSSIDRKPATSAQNDGIIARHGDAAQQALRKLGEDVVQHENLAVAHKQAIGSMVDSLDEQITLAKSASRETLAKARGQLRDIADKMQTSLNEALGDVGSAADHLLRPSVLAWRRAMDKLDAELGAAEKRGGSGK
jgi:hypothetical protein